MQSDPTTYVEVNCQQHILEDATNDQKNIEQSQKPANELHAVSVT